MKIYIFFFITCITVLLQAAPSLYNVLKLPASQVPVIDGNLDEWPQEYFIDSLHSDDNVRARDALEPWTREEIQMGLYMTWDDNWVYCAVKIIYDDVLITTGDSPWKMDNIRVNPGGQAMAFYIGINGTVMVNPSSPYTVGVNLLAAMQQDGNGDFPTYEFAIQKDMLYPFMMNNYQMAIGSEENDDNNTSDQCYAYVGFEYLGPKQDWNSSAWDNPLYYPIFTLVNIEGPPLNSSLENHTPFIDKEIELYANPNPFHPSTIISYSMESHGCLVIFDLNGRKVKTFKTNPGHGKISLNGADLASGTYFAKVLGLGKTRVIRLFLTH
jgi:hypothetical protein